MNGIIETPRLIIREINFDDLPGMFALDSNPKVHKHLNGGIIKSIDESNQLIGFIRQQYLDNGIGRWAMVEKTSGNFIGWTGFKFISETINGQSNYYDLGYRMLPQYWGNGYATESAKACLNYGVETLKLNAVYAMASSHNIASQNVLLKTGFANTGTFLHHNVLHHWFEIST